MKAAYLIKNGPAPQAFEWREVPEPTPGAGEVLIEVEAFGLNFADVMARLGLYRDAPPLPFVPGYDVVGRITAVGEGVPGSRVGERVTALTRFGGYAEQVTTRADGALAIPAEMSAGVAAALAVQGVTAVYMAEELTRLHPEDQVLVHAAAGGVGTLLVQLAKHHGCTVYGTAGSPEKLDLLRQLGVDHPINYRTEDFAARIREIQGESAGLDVIFDPIGGKTLANGLKLLAAGGRLMAFGGSSMTEAKNWFAKIRIGLSFGFYHPIAMLSPSRSLMGVNMLKLADQRPLTFARAFQRSLDLTEAGVLKPLLGGSYPAEQLAEAHEAFETRKTTGKLVMTW